MTHALAPCRSCHRHVRADEGRCPFCGAAHAAVARAPAPVARASRALILSVGAAASLGACDALVSTANADPMDPVSMAPQYGAPPGWDPPPPRPSLDAGAPPDASAPPPRR